MGTLDIISDYREKKPWDFSALPATHETASLETGDYTVKGFEDVFAIERKSLPDLLKSVSWDRDRFKAELDRAEAFAAFEVVIEASRSDIEEGNYRSKMHPNSVLGTIRAWSDYSIVRFVYAGDRENAQTYTFAKLREWEVVYADYLN